MDNQPQDLLDQFEDEAVEYAGFWQRFLALIVDGLVLLPIGILENYIRSESGVPQLILVSSLIGLAYKPFMEFKYGATLGKMALKIVVVNKQHQSPSLSNVLLRNIFDIGERLVYLALAVFSFGAAELTTRGRFAPFASIEDGLTVYSWLSFLPAIIVIVEIIFLLTDDRRRALHDRIGQTFVIKK